MSGQHKIKWELQDIDSVLTMEHGLVNRQAQHIHLLDWTRTQHILFKLKQLEKMERLDKVQRCV